MKFKKNKTLIKESIDNKYKDMISDYRKFANLDESVEITKENLDDFAIKGTCAKHNIQPYDLKHILLGEGVTLDQAARETESEVVSAENKNQVEKVLDRSLARAKRMIRRGQGSDFPNVLLVSDAGFGKTDMVRQWARENNINLVEKNLGTMGAEMLGGIVTKDPDDPKHATRIVTDEFINALNKPNTVLFLDEYNRSKTEIRGAILTLVQNHIVIDPSEPDGKKFLENLLFTIAAINPPNASYKGAKDLDPAEKSRYYTLQMIPDPIEHLKYLTKFYNEEIKEAEDDAERIENEGKLAIAKTILTNPDFTYDTAEDIEEGEDDPQYKPLNYRSFKLALDFSDGTKDDFLSTWNNFANYKKKPTIERILRNYKDVDDKATQALKGGTESDVFAKRKSTKDKLKELIPDLNI